MIENDKTVTGTREIALILKNRNSGFKVKLYLFNKRLFDILFSSLFLIIFCWLYLILAILVKCSSKGPIIYKHRRLGQYGKVINVYKFRSMIENAEANGAQFMCENDSRITKVGKVIRKLRIDELPQLFNILKGEMS